MGKLERVCDPRRVIEVASPDPGYRAAAPAPRWRTSLGPHGEPQSHPVWFAASGGQLLISTGTDRQKYRNIRRDPRVSVSILDPDNPYRYLEVRGRVVEIEPDPTKAFLDQLARKYLGQDTYPYEERRSVERVIVHIQPDHVVGG